MEFRVEWLFATDSEVGLDLLFRLKEISRGEVVVAPDTEDTFEVIVRARYGGMRSKEDAEIWIDHVGKRMVKEVKGKLTGFWRVIVSGDGESVESYFP